MHERNATVSKTPSSYEDIGGETKKVNMFVSFYAPIQLSSNQEVR